MQYLHLVYLAEQKGGVPAVRQPVPVWLRTPAVALRDERDDMPARQDGDSPFFTDGPYIETKEYPGGSRNF